MGSNWKNPTAQEQDNAVRRAFESVGKQINTNFFNQVCAGGETTFTFSVPQQYAHLGYRMSLISTVGAANNVALRFNADAGANYQQYLVSGAATAAAYTFAFTSPSNAIQVGTADDTAIPTAITGWIPLYAAAQKKTVAGTWDLISGVAGSIGRVSGLWTTAAAVTQMTVFIASNAFGQGSLIEFFGIV